MIIDLRSDTVTRPSAEMRRAMASAEVGDDVYGEDPTVNELQERVAELLGKEAALFVPSGSMANQICLKVHTQPGDDVVIGEGAHNYFYESGAGGAISGIQFTTVGKGGCFTSDEVRAVIKPDNHHFAPSTLVCIENTQNRGGGRVWPKDEVDRIAKLAGELGLKLHLDGARIMNAQVASGVSARELAAPFDSATLCLSKGLGAPVGSLLAGSRDFVHAAHRFRKMLGGGMRQAGVLAAAGLYALDNNVQRLAADHVNALVLFERLQKVVGTRVARPDTNILLVELERDAAPVAAAAAEKGLLFHAVAARQIRLVTHMDVDRDACLRAAEVLAVALSRAPTGG